MARLKIFHPQTRSRSAGRVVVVAAAVAAAAAQHGRVDVIIVTAPISTQLNEVTVQSVQWCGRAAAATHAADAGTAMLVLHTNTNKNAEIALLLLHLLTLLVSLKSSRKSRTTELSSSLIEVSS